MAGRWPCRWPGDGPGAGRPPWPSGPPGCTRRRHRARRGFARHQRSIGALFQRGRRADRPHPGPTNGRGALSSRISDSLAPGPARRRPAVDGALCHGARSRRALRRIPRSGRALSGTLHRGDQQRFRRARHCPVCASFPRGHRPGLRRARDLRSTRAQLAPTLGLERGPCQLVAVPAPPVIDRGRRPAHSMSVLRL